MPDSTALPAPVVYQLRVVLRGIIPLIWACARPQRQHHRRLARHATDIPTHHIGRAATGLGHDHPLRSGGCATSFSSRTRLGSHWRIGLLTVQYQASRSSSLYRPVTITLPQANPNPGERPQKSAPEAAVTARRLCFPDRCGQDRRGVGQLGRPERTATTGRLAHAALTRRPGFVPGAERRPARSCRTGDVAARLSCSGEPTFLQFNPLSGWLGQCSSDLPPSVPKLAGAHFCLLGNLHGVHQHALARAHCSHERESLGAR